MRPIYIPASGGDDAPAINAALATGATVELGSEVYLQSSSIIVPSNGRIIGQFRGTKVLKTADCDALVLNYCGTAEGFYLNGGTFKGRGIITPQGSAYQRIKDVHVYSDGYPLECVGDDSGGLMQVQNCFFGRVNPQAYAVKLPNFDSTVGGNRVFRDIFFSGGYGFDFCGSNNTAVDGINSAQIRMDASCRTLRLSNSRLGGPVLLRGQGHWWSMNNIANGIILGGDLTESLIMQPKHGAPILRQDPAANGNVVW